MKADRCLALLRRGKRRKPHHPANAPPGLSGSRIGRLNRIWRDPVLHGDSGQGFPWPHKMRRRQPRRMQKTIEGFPVGPILEMPTAFRLAPEGPLGRVGSSHERIGQVKPEDSRGRPAGRRIGLLLREELDLPAVRRPLGGHERQRGLGELDQASAIRMSGHEQLARDFRSIRFDMPHRLTLADGPVRGRQIKRRLRRQGKTTRKKSERAH